MTTNDTNEFSPAYQRWAEAEGLVSEFEREIFNNEHLLTIQELTCLRMLRNAAAVRLSELITDIDSEFGRLHALGEPADAEIHPIGDGVYLAVGPTPTPR